MSTDVLAAMTAGGYETVTHGYDRATGLRAIIAIHDTTLGPALGGIRMREYASEDEALVDVLRLAEAMTYKASVAGLALGGGKAVILGVPDGATRRHAFEAMGRIIDRLGGAYIPTEDMGTTTEDLVGVRSRTPYGVGLPESCGGGGDPSPTTAWGVLQGMRAVLVALGEPDSFAGRSVAVQGVGKVGLALVGLLVERGARVSVADCDPQRVARAVRDHGVVAVGVEDVLSCPVEILAPCAAGAVLDEVSIPRLQCRAVVGGANNQLATEGDAQRLASRGILYAPDFVVNAGGLIHVAEELDPRGFDAQRARVKATGIFETTARILAEARSRNELPHKVAEALARQRVAAARRAL
jgi:glutamate dehydrogenase/leucine dehydrogenase